MGYNLFVLGMPGAGRHGVQPVFAKLKTAFEGTPSVAEYLDAACHDAVDNFRDLTGAREDAAPRLPFAPEPSFTRYEVKLLIQHSAGRGAPVVYGDLPNYPNLVARLDHQARFGALSTDFRLIKPGALHEANGGYLLLDALRLGCHEASACAPRSDTSSRWSGRSAC